MFMREVGVKSSHKLTEWALKRKEEKYIHLEEQSVSVFSVVSLRMLGMESYYIFAHLVWPPLGSV